MRHVFGSFFGSFFAILALLVWGCATGETERIDPENSPVDTDSDTGRDTDTDFDIGRDTGRDSNTDRDTGRDSNTDRDTGRDSDTDRDTGRDSDTGSDTGRDSDTDSDEDTDYDSNHSCHLGDELTAPIDVLRLPCLPGRTTIMGVFEGISICEDYETKSFSFFQISPPHDLAITFGEGGELHATWDKDIPHNAEGSIDVTVTLPQNSSLPNKTLWGGFGSILRTPVAFDENYRMVLKSIKDSSAGLVKNDEIGICVIQ